MNGAPGYRAVWRWHFYAGLFCLPFVLWLSCTGAIYLWRPQVEALIDRPYDRLPITGPAAPAARQVEAALAAVPGSSFQSYELPENAHQAARILVARHGKTFRVYVHPQTLAILKNVGEEDRLMRVIFHLHGELLMGNRGSYVVELAASWAIVMILTGLYLWWPRGRGLAGVLWPRLGNRGRVFWRDLHAVTGMWVSLLALFMLVSGLPWAKSWGEYLSEVRRVTGTAVAHQDWTSGSDMASMGHGEHRRGAHSTLALPGEPAFGRVIAAARRLDFAAPVILVPPAMPGGNWTVRSDAANRPLRARATLDPAGRLISREDFVQRQFLDRTVGYSTAAHEGQLFGLANQLLGMFVALGLVTLTIGGGVMWWRRRPSEGGIGAPRRHDGDRLPRPIVVAGMLLGVALPLFGASALLVLATDRLAGIVRSAKRRSELPEQA